MSLFWHTEQGTLQQTQQPQLDQNQDFRLCHRSMMYELLRAPDCEACGGWELS